MNKVFILGVIVLCVFVNEVSAKGSKEKSEQDWVTKKQEVWIEKGVIYARGSAKMATTSMSMTISETRARQKITEALADNTLRKYPPLPADTKNSVTFITNGVSGRLGDIKKVSMYTADDGTFYTLISCAGAELSKKQ